MKKFLQVCLGVLFLVLMVKSGFAQNTTETEYQWVLGEVVSVDVVAKNIVIKYLDYETDVEKESTIYTDTDTVFEGAKSLIDIKPKDAISVDYVTQLDKNIAKKITVEKLESESEQPLPAKEEMPNVE